jgi:electron transfer flavoprotein-quinone oxidoreductase
MEQLFTVTNPDPKPGLRKIIRGQMKLNNVKLRDAISQGMKALRTFG